MLECVKYKHIGSIREIVEIVYRSSRGVGPLAVLLQYPASFEEVPATMPE